MQNDQNNENMTKKEEYKYASKQYTQDSHDARQMMCLFAVSLNATLWMILDRGIANVSYLSSIIFLLGILILAMAIFAKVFRTLHWRAVILDSSIPLAGDSTIWGRLTNWTFYFSVVVSFLSLLLFIWQIFS